MVLDSSFYRTSYTKGASVTPGLIDLSVLDNGLRIAVALFIDLLY